MVNVHPLAWAVAVTGMSLFCCLWMEKMKTTRSRQQIPHVVHVNGTRGKSTVCRLIDAGARAGGYRVMTKTTGTAACIRMPDGKEHSLIRFGRPSIREQSRVLWEAASQNVQVLVVECMAIDPLLQAFSQEKILQGNIGVITNVRRDHVDQMGGSLQAAAKAMAGIIPEKGILVTGETNYKHLFQSVCSQRQTEFRQATGLPLRMCGKTVPLPPEEIEENWSLAVDACQALGIDAMVALEGMRTYHKDPGAYTVTRRNNHAGAVFPVLNFLAVNDPDSMTRILKEEGIRKIMDQRPVVFVLAGRRDRMERLADLLYWASEWEDAMEELWVLGHGAGLVRRLYRKSGGDDKKIMEGQWIKEMDSRPELPGILFFGNTGGSGEEVTESLKGWPIADE